MPNTVIMQQSRRNMLTIISTSDASSTTNAGSKKAPLSWRVLRRASYSITASSLIVFMLCCSIVCIKQAVASSSSSADFSMFSSNQAPFSEQASSRSAQQQQQAFDSSNYKSIHEAIRGHPDLREFAALCEADGVKEIISMDKMPLTVFAPIDKSLGDLLAKSKARSINLIELAKHHIAQGFVMPDENTKYPLQFSTYSLLSPLYLTQVVHRQQQSLAASAGGVFVNNAKIIATHLIPIDAENYQTLHVIDQVIEFAYVTRRTQLRSPIGSGSSSGGSLGGSFSGGVGSNSASFNQYNNKKTVVKRSFSLDDLTGASQLEPAQQSPAYEFYERFGDIQAGQPQVDLYHARVFRGNHLGQQAASSQYQQQRQQGSQPRISLAREEFQFDRLMRSIRQHPQLRGRLFSVNESNSFNTYFLPLNSEELEALLDGSLSSSAVQALVFEAHVIPDQVLFTRTMALGVAHPTLLDRSSPTHRVSLSLAKTLPSATSDGSSPDSTLLSANSTESSSLASRQLLATPLLLQSKCSALPAAMSGANAASNLLRAGLTSSEILVANIPLNNGVLHLIKRPVLVTETSVLDYINDNENQLSDLVESVGSQSVANAREELPPVRVNRFRELLSRERQMLASFSMDPAMNKTILAPSDEAFSKLRFDLRALVQGDESLIPRHWDESYRHDLLERLVKRHVVLHQTITTDQIELATAFAAGGLSNQALANTNGAGPSNANLQVLSDNGKVLSFSAQPGSGEFLVDCDSTQARLVHHDLIGTNGVLHIIDRVLGEEQETVYSLLKSIVLKFNHSLEETAAASGAVELGQLIQSNIRNHKQHSNDNRLTMISTQQQPAGEQQASGSDLSQEGSSSRADSPTRQQQQQQQNPELALISKSIGQYLDELASSNRRQLQLLASSVNISYQLARLTSLAEGQDDWNERFKQPDQMFTYFVPSDLAWIRLQQAQPELYKPLMYFLEQQQQRAAGSDEPQSSQQQQQEATNANGLVYIESSSATSPGKLPRSSESSHRLRQILERHLVVNKKIAKKDLNQMESLQTLGATLRLVEAPQHQQLTDQSQQQVAQATSLQADGSQPMSAFAALHSIITGNQQQQQQQLQQPALQSSAASLGRVKALRLGDSANANIVQASEASNGFVYVIDSVLLLPEDSEYIQSTSATAASSSSMSSLLGAHNSAVLDFLQGLLAPSSLNLSAGSILAVIGTLLLAITVLLVLAIVLLVRRRRLNKLNRHQQLESGLTSSSSANSGSTSTTKSL